MFYLDDLPKKPSGFKALSLSGEWATWLTAAIPSGWSADVKSRLISNLKHVFLGLEMKAGLIIPQEVTRATHRPSVLFEPYFQVMTFEFCVGTFSVCEGLGSAIHLARSGGNAERRVRVDVWTNALVQFFDPEEQCGLREYVGRVKTVRDKMHQDSLGAREQIDWHDFGYAEAFLPAKQALECMLRFRQDSVPNSTNLAAPDGQDA